MGSSLLSGSIITSSLKMVKKKDEVYVAAVALRGKRGPAQLLMSTAHSLNLSWDLQHFMVLINSASPPHDQIMAFDFQPKDPENIYTALAVLAGKQVPGSVLARTLKKLPKNKCWFIGSCKFDNAVDAAYQFNASWRNELLVGRHDCRDYTNGLVELLVGEKHVLSRLEGRVSP